MSKRMQYIFSYSNSLDISVLRKVKMSIHQLGLQNTLMYLGKTPENGNDRSKKKSEKKLEKKSEKKLEKKSEKKPERVQVFNFIDDYLKDYTRWKTGIKGILVDKNKYQKNGSYAFAEIEIKRLIIETILVLESGLNKTDQNPINCDEKGFPQSSDYKNKQKGILQLKNDEDYTRKQENIARALISKGYKRISIAPVKSRDNSRMVVGISEPSTGEVGLRLNFLCGRPELPATAIRGVFRHYCEEHKKLNREKLEDWFGTEDREGRLLFLDAVPQKNGIKKEDDIITNHYGSYYQDEDSYPVLQKPILNTYKAVKIVKLDIYIFLKSDPLNPSAGKEEKEIGNIFAECIEKCSFGAKGALGYGYLKFVNEG